MAQAAAVKNKGVFQRWGSSCLKFLKENMGILIALMIICIALSFLSDVFITQKNILNVLRQMSTNLYLACGMTMVIILGGIDLSVGSIIAWSGVVTVGLIANNGMPIVVAVIAGIMIGVMVGAFNGIVIAKTTIPPFIVTLATMNIARGSSYIYTGGQPIRVMSDEFNFIGSGYIGEIPTPVIYLVIIVFISFLIMNKSKFGRHIYAVGGNAQAAKFSGINTGRVKFLVHTFSGLMAGITGVVLASRMFSGQPTSGEGAEMDAIAAVVLGGTSMSGGSGKIGGTVIGGFVIAVLNNGLNLMNVNSFWQYVVKGAVILIAVYVDYIKKLRSKI
ncbi:ABC transporter permease [Oscillospiraceae bacterium PP1C4]